MAEPPSHLNRLVGENVRHLRKQKGISQDEFADLCQLHRTYIGAVERAERNITLNTLARLAAALGVSPPDLLRKTPFQTDRGSSLAGASPIASKRAHPGPLKRKAQR